MGRQKLITITNAVLAKSSMQGNCKTYLVWEGLPKVTTYLKDENRKGWETSGEKNSILSRYMNKDPTMGKC